MEASVFTCRVCATDTAHVLLDLGQMPLANAFVTRAQWSQGDYRQGLTLMMCSRCRLIQLREDVPRERLFGSYLWVTGTSTTACAHAAWFADRLRRRVPGKAPFLLEAASNDGLFLSELNAAGFDVLGVEPSNLATETNERGLPTLRAFFGAAIAETVRRERGPADVIVARNVLGHASHLQDFVAGVKGLLAPDGVFVVEMPYAYFLRDQVQYDTIYHEHLSYFTIESLARLMERFGLRLVDVTFVEMNGGSMLCEIVHDDDSRPSADRALRDFEALIGLNDPREWCDFAAAVEQHRREFRDLLVGLVADGRRVVGYGAAAKCMTMLNYCGITPDLLPAIGDANPRKQGLLCPGVGIPVVSPEEVVARDPDFVVVGAWNLSAEIIELFRGRFGYRKQFIVPVPRPRIEG
jgi:SAM-dependent methyltransferase